MTCIAALVQDGKAYIAGDRGASDGDLIMSIENPKVWRHGEYLLGYYGTMHGEILQNFFEPPKVSGPVDKFMKTTFRKALKSLYEEWNLRDEEKDFGLIICVRGKIYEHNGSDLSMTTYDSPFLASGSGGSYAMGSLYSTQNYKDPKKRLRIALESAVEYSASCRGPIDILSDEEK